MKRFRSSLQRLLRVKVQAERLKQLGVSRARTEVDAATSRLSIAQAGEEGQLQELTARLSNEGWSLNLTLTSDTYRAHQEQTADARERQSLSQALLEESLCEYRTARQQRVLVERVLTHHREQHRRHALKAETIEAQDWSLRQTPGLDAALSEEAPHA